MSKQIAVRLPDELVSFIDDVVDEGRAASRAELVSRALEHERRRIIAERDVEILRQSSGQRDDLAGLTDYAARTPLDDLD
ncbi:ribbon-helix-helix domain-containing protein [Amycolatopsis pithecellobii]|uniref:Antitoxin n=1 Tax=Amycolatopsis pithecellobii TaxID=664692 RepID=A0A6N7YXH7_9PSEU|nr:ribbon-helix-helix domain-containing protein [Amycolatopsis pithecellobii]MTD57775.1 antitoxin [Amycolatopsis pithecellobii]